MFASRPLRLVYPGAEFFAAMQPAWEHNIRDAQRAVSRNEGPCAVSLISGSARDAIFWKRRFAGLATELFRADGQTTLVSVAEQQRKGNFLGTLSAWREMRKHCSSDDVSLMAMLVGDGKRLSPFTQALGNRKSRLPTPGLLTQSDDTLCTADLCGLYSGLWVSHLRACGFRGLIVKWGDEAIIPGVEWESDPDRFQDVDAIRFVWKTPPTEILAREKDWVAIDRRGRMLHQLPRQSLAGLKQALGERGWSGAELGVNLGSLAVGYPLLEAACRVFRQDIGDPGRAADWDPYLWIALFCRTEDEWRRELESEERSGRTGLRKLRASYPDFFARVTRLRETFEKSLGRPLQVGTLDFGQALWVDFGLHTTLRDCLTEITQRDSDRGRALRRFFRLPENHDPRGNIVVASRVAPGAEIENSILLNSHIQDPAAVVRRGVVVGGRHGALMMPRGGSALFCAGQRLAFEDETAVALRLVTPSGELHGGDRATSLFLDDGPVTMRGNEAVFDMSGENYSQPILGNPLSFAEAGRLMAERSDGSITRSWRTHWKRALD